MQLKNSNLKQHLEAEVETGRLRATRCGSCLAFSLTQSSVTVIVSGHVYLVPKLTGAGMCCCNVWCSGTLTPAAALALMPANVGWRDGAFFSPNAGADGCCQGVLGLQQATEVTFLMLVNIIKHSEKVKKSVQSVRACEWFILNHLHILMSSSQQWGIPI